MLGLLYRRTAEYCPGVVPRRVSAALVAAYRAGATRGFRQEVRLREVIESLREAGDRLACPSKGPRSRTLVYGDVAMRYATDLDLLVASADVARAAEVLVGTGWRLASQGQTAQHDLLEAAECELLLEHVKHRVVPRASLEDGTALRARLLPRRAADRGCPAVRAARYGDSLPERRRSLPRAVRARRHPSLGPSRAGVHHCRVLHCWARLRLAGAAAAGGRAGMPPPRARGGSARARSGRRYAAAARGRGARRRSWRRGPGSRRRRRIFAPSRGRARASVGSEASRGRRWCSIHRPSERGT